MARGACARRPCAGRKIATTRARPSSDPPRPSEPARVHRSTLFENCDLFLTSCCCARLPVIIFIRIRRLHDLVSSGHTPLTPHEQPRAIPVTVLNIHFSTPTHYLTSTGRNNSFCGRPCSPSWCRMGRPDVGPCSTHPGGSAGSSAGGGAARAMPYDGRKVAIFSPMARKSRFARAGARRVGAGCDISTAARALRTLEVAPAPGRAVRRRGRPPAVVAKSRKNAILRGPCVDV